MKKQIDGLVALQEIDTQIGQVKSMLGRVGQTITDLDARLVDFEKEIEERTATLAALKKEYRDYEAQVQVNQAMAEKNQEKARAVKTNREYRSLLKEIDDLKMKNGGIEDQMLQNLDRIEQAEKTIASRKDEFERVTREIKREKAEVESAAEKDRQRLAELTSEWQSACEGIRPDILNRFDRVREKIVGTVVVPVQNAVCQGCHMNIPPQMYNEVQRCDSLKFCPHCERIIYWHKA